MTVGVGLPVPPSRAPTAVSLTPRILWPSLERTGSPRPDSWQPVDLDAFPDAQVINERRRRGEAVTYLPIFKKHVTSAVDRVLIVDTYLLCGGERAEEEVLSWFPDSLEAHNVQIACGGLKDNRNDRLFMAKLTDRAAAINTRKAGSGAPATTIKLKLTLDPRLYPFVHDRFAVVDNELWHFGATVGGLHHGVNAATRGWSATAVRAEQFFKQLWSQPARGGGIRTACNSGTR